MGDECTPDTDAVREAWLWHQKAEDERGLLWGDHNDQFNRWLTEHDTKVQAELEAELVAVRATVDRVRALAEADQECPACTGYGDIIRAIDGGGE